MSTTVQSVYDQVTAVMLEPDGFTSGAYTQAQFLNALGVVLLDLAQRAPLDKKIYTQRIVSGTSIYTVPEDIMSVDMALVGGKLIEHVSEADLVAGHVDWKAETGPPRQWHEDNLDVKKLQLYPKPDYTGTAVAGDGYGEFAPAGRNLTIIGSAAPSKTAWAIGDTLDGIPDSFMPYLVYGILEQIFDAEGETRDAQRAAYCHARFMEGVGLSMAIVAEELSRGGE